MENITLEEFLEDEMRVDAVVRNLEIIGEAAGKIPPETRYLFTARAGYLGGDPQSNRSPLTAPDDSYTILIPRSFAIIPTGIFLTYH
ncbi:DUF86 domain-containing protein [Methanolobus sp.]|uniref:HepT-like ribonuclease domain-containing protein n=1 Tax=Methanolobus sp. TaxID=1874737 RepID=UPI0027308DCC|nr:HepT-like ribonuclease domain-containing protein [Methanolobus sp.]